jgi:hypothetical protein
MSTFYPQQRTWRAASRANIEIRIGSLENIGAVPIDVGCPWPIHKTSTTQKTLQTDKLF